MRGGRKPPFHIHNPQAFEITHKLQTYKLQIGVMNIIYILYIFLYIYIYIYIKMGGGEMIQGQKYKHGPSHLRAAILDVW